MPRRTVIPDPIQPRRRRDRKSGPKGSSGPKGHKGGKKPHRTDPRVRARAEKLAANGMPFQMAMAVALGRVSLNDALERLARQDKVDKTMEEHDLSRALATQVVIGHADLDKVLARRRMQEHREENRLRSCLEQARESGEPLAVALHGDRKVIGKVIQVEQYEVVFEDGDGEQHREHKLQLKFAWDPADWKRVRKGLKTDKALAADPLAPVERPQDRYTCSDKRLFRYMDDEVPVQATLLEGEQLRGTITWFGRYEFGMELKGGAPVTVFRHCLHDLREA